MDWTGLDSWTGQLDWTVGLDIWTGQLDWTIGLGFFSIK